MDIKFRAWSTSRNKMLTPSEVTPVFWPSLRFCEYNSEGKQIELPLMQFIGKHDSECNEIYRSDIISDHVGIGIVVWCNDKCAFKVSYRGENKGLGKFFSDYLDSELKSIIVIGNQYQNGDLIK